MIPKKIILLPMCVLLFQIGQAQYIGVSAGFAFPVGDFGNQNINDPENGFANNGKTLGLSINYLVKNNIGFYASYQYNAFGLNDAALTKQSNLTAPPQTNLSIKSSSDYRANTVMVGPSITLGKQNLTFQIRLAAGILSLSKPAFTTTSTFSNTESIVTTSSQQSVSVAVGYGLGVQYALPKDIYLMLNLDNTSGISTFVKDYQSSSGNTFQMPYQAYSLSIGLGYSIQ